MGANCPGSGNGRVSAYTDDPQGQQLIGNEWHHLSLFLQYELVSQIHTWE